MEQDKNTKFSPNVSQAEFNVIGKDRGIKNYCDISKYDLVERLGS